MLIVFDPRSAYVNEAAQITLGNAQNRVQIFSNIHVVVKNINKGTRMFTGTAQIPVGKAQKISFNMRSNKHA